MSALAFAALLALGYFIGILVTAYLLSAFTEWEGEASGMALVWPLVPPLLLLDYVMEKGRQRREARR